VIATAGGGEGGSVGPLPTRDEEAPVASAREGRGGGIRRQARVGVPVADAHASRKAAAAEHA
jgi:hypothetical protein